MRGKGYFNRGISFVLVFLLMITYVDLGQLVSYAQEDAVINEQTNEDETEFAGSKEEIDSKYVGQTATGYIDLDREVPSVDKEDLYQDGRLSLDKGTVLPSVYSSVEKGYVTPIKNQNPWGTCWAFAACAAMESYALSHGMAEGVDSVDFSEYALVFLTHKDDLFVEQTGDYTTTTDTKYYGFDMGGNDEFAFKSLSKWAGIYNEGNYYTNIQNGNETITEYVPDPNNIDYVFTGQSYINMSDMEQIKAAIMENGAVTASYFSDSKYANNNYTYNYNYEKKSTNHAIAIVGWNDSIEKEKFTITNNGKTYMPQNNGAWLVKNSWGPWCGNDGYIWISYEDLSISSGVACVYEVAPKAMFDNIYQHDGATFFYTSRNSNKFANVYEITGEVDQKIQAVSFALCGSTNRKYTVNIYKNIGENKLEAGELVATKTGKTTYEGYYTVFLDAPITAAIGETYTVVILFEETTSMLCAYNGFPFTDDISTVVCTSKEGESFYGYNNKLVDIGSGSNYSNFCIKMYTTDDDGGIESPQITDVVMTDVDKIQITWQTISDALSYELWIGDSLNDATPEIISVTGNTYTYTSTLGEAYCFKVKAIYANNVTSLYSIPKSFEAEIPKVTLNASYSNEVVSLSWNAISFVDGYKLYRSVNGGEYELLKEMGQLTSYEDKDVSYMDSCKYYVVAYVTLSNNTTVTSNSSAVKTVDIPIPSLYTYQYNNNFYGKIVISWNPIGDKVAGYVITAEDDATNEQVFSTVIEGGNVSKYEFDTTGYEAGTTLLFDVQAYILVDGVRYLSSGCTLRSYVEILDKNPPLNAELKWYVDSYERVILTINEDTQDVVKFLYYENLEQNSCYMSTLSVGTRYSMSYIPYENVGYVYITDEDMDTFYQDEPYKIGGPLKIPALETIKDVKLSSTGETVLLKAEITNEMENFDYKYQWYVSDSKTGNATAISGATESTYEATVGSYEKKYYYCKVTTVYKDTYYSYSTNGAGERTCIMGELYGTNVLVEDISDYTYTGLEIKPKIVVRDGETNEVLTEGTDYTVAYSNNINVGKASVTVTFKGMYSGKVTKYFNIIQKGISGITVSSIANQTYTGSAITPGVTLNDGSYKLVENKDYTLAYSNNINAGMAVITITFKGNYTGVKTVNFKINPKSTASVIVSAIGSQTYSGSAIAPALKILDGTKQLTKDIDYTVVYSNNTNAGTASVTITFKGNYAGTKSTTFVINPKNATNVSVETISDVTYTGGAITPAPVVKDGNVTLVKDRDYVITYSNNVSVGTAKAVFAFTGNYTGSKELTFKINAKTASELTYDAISSVVYTGSSITPNVVVRNGALVLTKDKDYTLSYSNNMNVGTATVVITFKGNYTGTKSLNFKITAKSGANASVSDISGYTYTGSALTPGLTVSVDSITLVKDRDYILSYSNNINAGNATVTITFKGNYTGSKSVNFKILPKAVTNAVVNDIGAYTYTGNKITPSVTVKEGNTTFVSGTDYTLTYANNTNVGTATVTITFKGNYSGATSKTFVISAKSADGLSIQSIANQKYTGKAITPSVVIKDGTKVLVLNTDYTVSYQDNIQMGTAKVTVVFKGNYSGTKNAYFEIVDPVPDKVTSSNVTVNDNSGYVSKITVGTTVQTLVSSVNEKEYVSVRKDNKEVAKTSAIGTGMLLCIMDDGKVTKSYTIIVTGDTNGDSKINITDMIAVKANILKKSSLNGVYAKAGDVNGDSKINITDFIKIKATLLKKDSISGVAAK